MRLINTTTFKFEEFEDIADLDYAILSHTWRDGEILFADFVSRSSEKAGLWKIKRMCQQAFNDGLQYAWIDTACIDKTSSAELSEAINSMFRWYEDSQICYAYIDDVTTEEEIPDSRWIRRGWTLQELIAPKEVKFYNKDWNFIGCKSSMIANLVLWTNVDGSVLKNADALNYVSIANRMSWVSQRKTTRIEDIAYCLLGIFDVNMPLIYGEGHRAFRRLQEEILRKHASRASPDISILLWTQPALTPSNLKLGYLADSPQQFHGSHKIVAINGPGHNYRLSQNGLRMDLRILVEKDEHYHKRSWGILQCRFEHDLSAYISIPLIPSHEDRRYSHGRPERFYMIDRHTPFRTISEERTRKLEIQTIHLCPHDRLAMTDDSQKLVHFRRACQIEAATLLSHGFEILCEDQPNDVINWSPERATSEILTSNNYVLRNFAFIHTDHQEAFIISFLDQFHPGPDRAKLTLTTKPECLGIQKWLENVGFLKSNSGSKHVFDEDRLPTFEDFTYGRIMSNERHTITKLQSGSCYRKIEVEIEETSKMDICVWKLHVKGRT